MTPSAPPSVAVILVHYGDYAAKHFEPFLDSWKRQTLRLPDPSLFIVNNGADDQTDDWVRARVPGATHLRLTENKGWSRANNEAIRRALDTGFQSIILLNMDVVLEPQWLECLIKESVEHSAAHIFQSKILLYGTRKINSIGNKIHFLGYGYCYGYGAEDDRNTPAGPIQFASGAAMLIQRRVFESVGLLEDKYFLYYDDLEFCWRARLAGFGVALAPSSVCYHKHEIGSKLRYLYLMEFNRLLTLFTLMSPRNLSLIVVPLLISQIVSGIYFAVHGYLPDIFRLYVSLAKTGTWRFIRQKRRVIESLRIKKDREFMNEFSSKIFFAGSHHEVIRRIANPLLSAYWRVIRWIFLR